MKLPPSFYLETDVSKVARALLGKIVAVDSGCGISKGMIIETEAYSYKERACHAYNNRRTERTEILFMEGGHAYVYLCYGIHRLFNVVTNSEGMAEAVLIRAIEPLQGIEMMKNRRNHTKLRNLTSGPGKLSAALGITLEHNAISLSGNQIWLEDGKDYRTENIISGPRVGVDYAGTDAGLPWRFAVQNNPYISIPFPG